MVAPEPDWQYWQEEQRKRLEAEDAWARIQQEFPVEVRIPKKKLTSVELRKTQWSALLQPILDGIKKSNGKIDDNGLEFIKKQCTKMGDMILSGHEEALRYRSKGRAWRALRNRSEQYLLEFRRATQYYFCHQRERSSQRMDPAVFRTAVADFHAALSTTLRVLRMALGEQENQVEIQDVVYDSDDGDPIINLNTNYSTPQPFNVLIQGFIEMTEVAKKKGLSKSGTAANVDPGAIAAKELLEEKLNEQVETVAKLQREKQEFLNARGPPPPGRNCAQEKAEIDRLENDLKMAQETLDELRVQFEQQSAYIDSVARGQRVPEIDIPEGINLSRQDYDQIMDHFQVYHGNAEDAIAREKAWREALANHVLHLDNDERNVLTEQMKDEIAQTQAAMDRKEKIIADTNKKVEYLTAERQSLRHTQAKLETQITALEEERDQAVRNYDAVKKLQANLQSGVISDDVYNKLKAEKDKLAAQIEQLENDAWVTKKTSEDLQEELWKRDAEIRGLNAMLAYDRDASKDRQEILDLRERVLALEHELDNERAKNAIQNYIDPDDRAPPDNPEIKAAMDKLKSELELHKTDKILLEAELEERKTKAGVEAAEFEARGTKIEALENQITALRKKEHELTKRYSDCQQRIMELQDKKIEREGADTDAEAARAAAATDLGRQLAEVQKELVERDRRMEEVDNRMAESTTRHEQQIRDLQKALDDARLSSNGISPDALRKLRNNFADCRRQHEDDQITIAKLEGELDACKRRGEQQSKQLEKWIEHHQAAGAGATAAAIKKGIDKELAELKIENTALEEELQRVEKERDEKAVEIRKTAEELHKKALEDAAADQAMRDESIASYDSNEEVNKEHIARIKMLGEVIRRNEQIILDTQLELNVSRKTVESLQAQRDQLQNQIREIRKANRDLREQNLEAVPDDSEQVTELEARINQLETDLATCHETGATLQLQRDAAIAENEGNKQKMADLQTAHDAMAGEGPKLGMKRIKTRIANQAKATKARNLAAKKAKEEAEEQKREAARQAAIAAKKPPPKKTPSPEPEPEEDEEGRLTRAKAAELEITKDMTPAEKEKYEADKLKKAELEAEKKRKEMEKFESELEPSTSSSSSSSSSSESAFGESKKDKKDDDNAPAGGASTTKVEPKKGGPKKGGPKKGGPKKAGPKKGGKKKKEDQDEDEDEDKGGSSEEEEEHATGPRRSSFVTDRPATRPKVTFEDEQSISTAGRGTKRALPPPRAPSTRMKRPRR